jgi:isopenicillin N synthase-like dioxygenase
MRIGEHSDYGTITLLWQLNDVPGLEVQDLGGVWHPVPYEKDSVVVNIGDLLQDGLMTILNLLNIVL